jgi:energy-converting hydrogenase Eha subunit E
MRLVRRTKCSNTTATRDDTSNPSPPPIFFFASTICTINRSRECVTMCDIEFSSQFLIGFSLAFLRHNHPPYTKVKFLGLVHVLLRCPSCHTLSYSSTIAITTFVQVPTILTAYPWIRCCRLPIKARKFHTTSGRTLY